MLDPQEIEQALSSLATQAEDIGARLFEAYPRQARVFQKFAAYCRSSGNCLRVYGSLPEAKAGPPLVQAAKVLTSIQREVSRVNALWPRKD